MIVRELIKKLLDVDQNKNIAVSIDMSKGNADANLRSFSDSCAGIVEDSSDNVRILFELGHSNNDEPKKRELIKRNDMLENELWHMREKINDILEKCNK